MPNRLKTSLIMATAFALAAGSALAQDQKDRGHEGGPAQAGPHDAGSRDAGPRDAAPRDAGARQGEPYAGPRGYQRPAEPQGWNTRPTTVDRGAYQHNYRAARTYHVGPYHPPSGWAERRWAYGEILPRAYWASEYYLSDYWLFGLEVPPGGFEWVRSGPDALLVDLNSGEILQVEYGVFV